MLPFSYWEKSIQFHSIHLSLTIGPSGTVMPLPLGSSRVRALARADSPVVSMPAVSSCCSCRMLVPSREACWALFASSSCLCRCSSRDTRMAYTEQREVRTYICTYTVKVQTCTHSWASTYVTFKVFKSSPATALSLALCMCTLRTPGMHSLYSLSIQKSTTHMYIHYAHTTASLCMCTLI